MVIWQYSLALTKKQSLIIPSEFRYLDIQLQNGNITIWFLVTPNVSKKEIEIFIYPTGYEEVSVELIHNHLKTLQMDGYVWHFFIGN